MPIVYRNQTLDACFGDHHSDVYPDTFHAEAYYAIPVGNVGGTPADYTGYARTAVPNDSANWPDAEDELKANALQIDFPTPWEADWRGTWTDSVAFVTGNVVIFNDIYYVALADNTAIEPDTDDTKWEQLDQPVIVAIGLHSGAAGDDLVCWEKLPDPITVSPNTPLFIGVGGVAFTPPL